MEKTISNSPTADLSSPAVKNKMALNSATTGGKIIC